MADTHREVDEAAVRSRKLMDNVREITTRIASLDDILSSMHTMKDGDGSQASHFAKVVTLFGVQGADQSTKLANAKVIYDELNSAMGNSAALRQFLGIMG